MTPLDKAYAAAMQSKDEATFYNEFLRTEIFIATVNLPSDSFKQTGEKKEINPIN